MVANLFRNGDLKFRGDGCDRRHALYLLSIDLHIVRNQSLRQFLQAGANERGGLRLMAELRGDPGHSGGGLRMSEAEADEGQNRVLRRLWQLGRALGASVRAGEIGPAKRRRLVLELEHEPRSELRADAG